MAQSINVPEDVVNAALAKIGAKVRISNFFDGSMAAKKALDMYGQSRDALLRNFEWGFANAQVAGVTSGQAAPAPWSFEYNYPTDAIRILNIFNSVYTSATSDPLPNQWKIANNSIGNKIIWCNISGAEFVYTKRVTDPTKWEPGFADALILMMAKRLSKGLVGIDAASLELKEDVKDPQEEEEEVG